MDLRSITPTQISQFNKLVTHVVQSYEWGEFREKLGLKVLRYGLFKNDKLEKAFQLTLHPIPFLNKTIGYLPKGPYPDKDLTEALTKIAQENNCIAIKVEPNIVASRKSQESSDTYLTLDSRDLPPTDRRFIKSSKEMFTKHNFVLDLTLSEEELLKRMHPKTRYNIRVAQKHDVKVEERVDEEAFKIYLKLYFETTKRQGYHGHNEEYHRLAWETLKEKGMARLLIAFYQKPGTSDQIPLTAWMLFNFKDVLYYPYGGSSVEHREVMANNLVAWEAIKLGQKLKLKSFDMWGALGPSPNPNDPFIGFHRFKSGYGGELVEYLGSFDLIINKPLFYLFNLINQSTSLKVALLKLLKR